MDGHFGSLKGLGLLVSRSHWHLSPLSLQLWKSDDFGQTWIMIQEHVKSFSWYVSHPAPVFSHSSLLALFAALWEPRIRVPGCVPALSLLPSPCAGGMCHSRVTSDSHPHWHPRVLPIPPAPSPCSCCLLLQSHHIPCPPRGVEPYDKPSTVYIERHEPSGASTVIRSTDFFQSRENKEIILEDVEDFQLRDKYMFATKSVVSDTRGIRRRGSGMRCRTTAGKSIHQG